MGLIVNLPKSNGEERTLQLNFGIETFSGFLPAEWHAQSVVQLTWPHAGTDWAPILDEANQCYVNLASAIASRQNLLIVTPEPEHVKSLLHGHVSMERIFFFTCDTNDTWTRDYGFITVLTEQGPLLLDFCFNGWGMKFAANYDNQINRRLYASGYLRGAYQNGLDFVLEGGSIESDGRGTLLVTSTCLLSPNRNDALGRVEIEERLCSYFHLERVLWLEHGYLAGDDTDSHIDTLVRFCPNDTLVYVSCIDKSDEHYTELSQMEAELQAFRTLDGRPYRLLPLPMPEAIIENGERLPATYANFLIINTAVLYPMYGQSESDREAASVLTKAFPNHDIIGIDCRVLIKQHGSLHCATMQYPTGCFTSAK